MSNIRYPGSKHKLRGEIIKFFPPEFIAEMFSGHESLTYVEPFFGSGAVGWEILSELKPRSWVVINDLDYSLMCLWNSVRQQPEELIDKIRCAQLSHAIFAEYKSEDGDRDIDIVESGFRKLLLHQMSFSGLGAKAGGPIGGASQSNEKYNIRARWNPVEQISKVRERHKLMKQFQMKLHCEDFEKLISDYDSPHTLFYCDPPYVDKGEQLYKFSFGNKDHTRLLMALAKIRGKFVVSYDDHPAVRILYSDYTIRETDIIYSIAGARKNHELIITNF